MSKAYSNTASAATPVTITMNRDYFYRWLSQIQGSDDEGCDDPDFVIDEVDERNSPYFLVEAFAGTTEGTVIARHLRGSDRVKVTIHDRDGYPDLTLIVGEMIDETRAGLKGEVA
ncbi:hypothetical protein SAMN04488103_105283 [Gemmobacter aquatilis]|uniref:Uncharacterized protein n=1 Tax=Gemmobacter aquatilis TaxID=933059 RepID=A0A1H8HA81_9RHOB|nr:hypothetical protein [Gemmobacter aquatilis]SEN52667.1 hypothetical protein SAMN04488103_105283 [Gemmobacter aquatilis]